MIKADLDMKYIVEYCAIAICSTSAAIAGSLLKANHSSEVFEKSGSILLVNGTICFFQTFRTQGNDCQAAATRVALTCHHLRVD
jgi:hypothetical protein